jgi:hypothetical protein
MDPRRGFARGDELACDLHGNDNNHRGVHRLWSGMDNPAVHDAAALSELVAHHLRREGWAVEVGDDDTSDAGDDGEPAGDRGPYEIVVVLRVRAAPRHRPRLAATGAPVRFGRLRLDRDAHRAWVDDVEVILTALEFRLLSTFLARRGRVQSRDSLLSDVWGIRADVTTRTVDTHVKRLREKLGDAGAYIETLRGVAYRFRDQPEGS